eukprot:m.242242 g.242242  ORF g.242242 m.242242 type:complete len:752 (+) comp40218_c1_seq5:739-2994(+)
MAAFLVVFLMLVGNVWTLDWKIVNPTAWLSGEPHCPESIGAKAVDGFIPSGTELCNSTRTCAIQKNGSVNPKDLTIDLKNVYMISAFTIHLRERPFTMLQNGLRVYVGNQKATAQGNTQCGGEFTYTKNNHPNFVCVPPIKGRFVFLTKVGNQFPKVGIQVCEVEVKAGSPCEDIPPPPDHFEFINSTGYHYNDTASMKCKMGYLPKKPQLFRCDENRAWKTMKKMIPCKLVNCTEPPAHDNGYVEGSSYTFGDQVQYMCNDGYKRVGASKAQCMANGSWSAGPPLCKQLTCSLLKPPKCGRLILGGNTVGSRVKISCNRGCETKIKGQKGVGEAILECKQIGAQTEATAAWTWSGHLSTNLLFCQPKNCGISPDFQQGSISYMPSNSTLYGSKATYKCKEEYEMKGGDAVRFCGEDGKWNGTEPYCEHKCATVDCPPFQDCHVVNDNATCQCFSKEKCNSDYDPKCGDDGRTYNNECLMKVSGCKRGNPDIQVVKNGECKYSGVCLTNKPAPPKRNPCRGFFPRYYFDFTTGSCEKFIFGGCFEGNNSFISEEECEKTCQIDPCGLRLDPGPCKMKENRWYYNETTRTCQQFEYSGCFGNENNFGSELRCVEKCVNQTVPTQQAVTSPPPAPKCCKIKKNRKKLCSENQFVVFAKILNVTKNKEGLQAYDIKTILSIKGKKTAMASSKSLKIVRNGDCSNVICPPLKIKQKYLIGFQTHKNSKLVLNDKYYIEEIEEKFADSNFSCRTNK